MNTMVQTLKDMGQVKLAALAGAAVVLIGLFIFMSLRVSAPVMSPLYSGLSMEDSGRIVSELEKSGIKYELRADGAQILIPSDQVTRSRLTLAQQGLPSGGSVVGYEIFDRSEALGTSNFVLNVNMLRALEGELARTISSLSQVESARVHLVMSKRELFTRDKQEPTASVYLKLKGRLELSKQEINAISHLVATAVPGLKVSGITIIDSAGRLLTKGSGEGDSAEMASSNAQEFRINYENRMKDVVESLLARSVGEGKVKAQVTSDIDFDRIVTNSEKFDPEGQVARSVQGTQEKETSSEKEGKDNVSVANNLPDANGSQNGASSNQRVSEKTDETTNYEISKTVQNHIKESGTVKRLSVAVLVDGTYAQNDKGEQVYTPRSAEELKQLESLVKSAVGYDEKRGDTVEVVNMRFSPNSMETESDSPFEWLKQDMHNIVQTLVLGGVAILAILLIIRPLVNRAIEASGAGAQAGAEGGAAMLGGPSLSGAARLSDHSGGEEGEEDDSMIDIDRINGKVRSSSFRKINEIIEKHPEEALNVIRQWVFREA